jgi:hypothetical protein
MTSAAIPMAIPILMSAEQTGLLAASSDKIAGETVPSFAQRLSESVSESEIVKGKRPEGKLEDLLLGLKDASIAKRVDERTDGLSSVKGTIAGQKPIAAGQSVSNAAARVSSRSVTPLVAQGEISDVRFNAKDPKDSQQIEEPLEELSGGSNVSQGSTERALITFDPKQSGVTVIGDRPAALIAAGTLMLKDAGDETKAKESNSAKEASKPQSSVSAPKAEQRSLGASLDGGSMMATPAATLVASASPVVQQVDQASAATQKEFVQTAMGLDGTVSRGERARVRSGADYGSNVKEVLNGTKAAVSNPEEPGTPAGAGSGMQKPDADGSNQSAMQPVRDVASTPEPTASKGHPLMEGPGVSATPTGVETGAIGYQEAVGHAAKMSFMTPSAHPTDLVSASKEQESRGALSMPLEETPRMLAATPRTLEVGIQNGTHGWLRVRAEISDGGGVNASVQAPSFSAKEMLSRELPSLSTYLEQEKIAVNSVVIHSPIATIVESNAPGQSLESGAGSQTPQRGGQQGQPETSDSVRADRMKNGISGPEVSEDGLLPAVMYGGGSWLSVRA